MDWTVEEVWLGLCKLADKALIVGAVCWGLGLWA